MASCPGFPRALAATLSDLRLAGVDAESVASQDADLGHLLAAYQQACSRVGVADRADLLSLATQAVGHDPEGLTRLPLVLLDVPIAHPAEREFAAALVREAPSALVTVPEGDVATLEAMRALAGEPEQLAETGAAGLDRLRRYLFEDESAPSAEPDDTVHFFSAPGEGRECVEIAREIVRASRRGVRFDEMAVLLRAPEVYSGLLSTALRRADVPAWFARGVRRPDPAGRAFLALLACACEQLSARRFAEYLAFAQVPDLESGSPPQGRSQWAPRARKPWSCPTPWVSSRWTSMRRHPNRTHPTTTSNRTLPAVSVLRGSGRSISSKRRSSVRPAVGAAGSTGSRGRSISGCRN